MPLDASSGFGDFKHQECMYGISEAPDGGFVVSGNISSNLDDNYMAKIKGDCNSNDTYTAISYVQDLVSGQQPTTNFFWDNQGTNPWLNFSTPIRIKNELRIKSGVTLDATEITFEFGENGRITIEPGAKLVLHGCTLRGSTTCKAMWQGIRVLGNYGTTAGLSSADPVNNGTLLMDDFGSTHTVVQHAVIGVTNWNYINDYSYDNTQGGRVIADNVLFIDNLKAVEIVGDGQDAGFYQHSNIPNRSILTDCEFSYTTAKLLYPYTKSAAECAISLIETKDFDLLSTSSNATKFIGFGNTATTRLPYAILSYDAFFDVKDAQFTKCQYGISCLTSNVNSLTQHTFEGNEFNNCYYGILMRNGMNDLIQNNAFNTQQNPMAIYRGSSLPNKYAIYLDGTTGFNIKDNVIQRVCYGITVLNSDVGGGFIHPGGVNGNGPGNVLSNCWRAITTSGNNPNLSVKCNSVSNFQSSTEFNYGWYNKGEIKEQGKDQFSPGGGSPAGNVFGHSGGNFRKDIANYPTHIFKYNHSGTAPIVVNVALSQVFTNPNCDNPELMVLANYDAEAALLIINAEADDELRETYLRQLSAWYDNNDLENERIQLLLSQGSLSADEQLFPIYLNNEQYVEALNLLNERLGLTDDDNKDYFDVGYLQLGWAQNNLSALEMTLLEQEQLRQISEHDTRASATALALLNYLVGTDTTIITESDTTEKMRKVYTELTQNTKATTKLVLTVKPNPADEVAHITWQLPIPILSSYILRITDLTGRTIETISISNEVNLWELNTKEMNSGIYFAVLYRDEIILDKQKISINHK